MKRREFLKTFAGMAALTVVMFWAASVTRLRATS